MSHLSHIDCSQKLFEDNIDTSKLTGFFIMQVGGNMKNEDIILLGFSKFVPTLSFIELLPVPRGLISYLHLTSSKTTLTSFRFASLYTNRNIPIYPSSTIGDVSSLFSLTNMPPKNDCPPPLLAL